MAEKARYTLVQDKKGMYWDLALYIPTLIALISLAIQLWYSGNQNITYLLIFLATFIFLIAFNRIAKTRLMLLPSAPVAFSVSKQGVKLYLRNGDEIELVKNVRFFSDFAGKSFGLSGVDLTGKQLQYVFHKGQFASESEFGDAKAALRIFK